MGVNGLLGLLKSIQRQTHIKNFQGRSIGVDAYGWLHRGAVACAIELAQGKPTSKYVDFAMHRVRMLRHFGAIPYIVFDGDRLPSKARTEQDRAARRRESRTSGLELLRMGRTAQAYQELQKAVDITPEMARELIEVLKHEGVQYIVAPYEADSQLAYLEKKGIIDAILSEDSDLLVFGARCLLTKLDQYGECTMIRQDDFTACREVNLAGWTTADLRMMAILSGCDYLEGIHKMGLKTAHRLIRKYKTIDRLLRALQLEGKIKVPQGYFEEFRQAETTFLYQWVFCPEAKGLVNLTQPQYEGQLDGISYIGQYLEPEIARRVAIGDWNPMTKEPIVFAKENIIKHLQRTPGKPRSKSFVVESDLEKNKSITNFFKPNRVPLAELEPNSLRPRISGREWVADSAPQRPSSSLIRSVTDSNIVQIQRPIQTAPQARKRPRLCGDDGLSPIQDLAGSGQGEKSKFFAKSPGTASISSLQPTRKKKKAIDEFDIWSDDSIEEAMASISAQDVTPAPSKLLGKKLAVSREDEQSQCNMHASGGDTAQKKSGMSRNTAQEIPLTRALLDEAQDLRDVSSNSLKVFDSKKYNAVVPLGDPPEMPITRGADFSAKLRHSLHKSPPTVSKIESETSAPLIEVSPVAISTKIRARVQANTKHRNAPLQPPEPVSIKGSEDLMIPDSDAGSEADLFSEAGCVPGSSPLRQESPGNNESEEGDRELTPRPVLNLSRFAFAATGNVSVR